ncbi:MAG: leucine-rich repeat domain-containing protein [Firmicutes bacterium]|nr:leucine-rich repeat domain-containing protein [Bacillota bacterium]
MKKIRKILLLPVLLLMCNFILVACNNDNNNGHSHDWNEWVVTTIATCLTDGEETRTCKHDSSHIETRPIVALGHNWDDWEITTSPTCTEVGEETRICLNDASHTETKPIIALGHDMLWIETTPATCTEAAIETGTCQRNGCTHTDTRSGEGAISHDWEWVVTTPATKTTDGVETLTCRNNPAHTNGTRILYATGTEGLVFSGGYLVSIGTATDLDIVIPAFHNRSPSPSPVIGIGYAAFRDSNIVSVTIPASVRIISHSAFSGSDSLKSVVFQSGSTLETIEAAAFWGCVELTSITIPASVRTVGTHLFFNCSKLESAIFEEGSQIEILNDTMFFGSGLRTIEIPKSVTRIREGVFQNSSNLESVTFEEGSTLQRFGNDVFNGAGRLSDITIPEGVTHIGNRVFAGTRLSSITIPASVQSIGNHVFIGDFLEYIEVDEDNEFYSSIDGALYNKAQTVLIVVPKRWTGDFVVPEGVIEINSDAFHQCSRITSITLPESLEIIGNSVFTQMNINSLTIPAGVVAVGDGVFAHWSASRTIYILGHTSEAEADAAWGIWWRDFCNANIVYAS